MAKLTIKGNWKDKWTEKFYIGKKLIATHKDAQWGSSLYEYIILGGHKYYISDITVDPLKCTRKVEVRKV